VYKHTQVTAANADVKTIGNALGNPRFVEAFVSAMAKRGIIITAGDFIYHFSVQNIYRNFFVWLCVHIYVA
jgi:hypothetical protein